MHAVEVQGRVDDLQRWRGGRQTAGPRGGVHPAPACCIASCWLTCLGTVLCLAASRPRPLALSSPFRLLATQSHAKDVNSPRPRCVVLCSESLSAPLSGSPFRGSDRRSSFPTPPAGQAQGTEGVLWEQTAEEELGGVTKPQVWASCVLCVPPKQGSELPSKVVCG